MNERKLFIIALGLVLIVLGVIGYFFLSRQQQQPPSATGTIEHPNEAFPITQSPEYIEKITEQPFWDMLPHWGENYKIDYKQSAGVILITTFPADGNTQTYRSQALQWIRDNGGSPDELTIEYAE